MKRAMATLMATALLGGVLAGPAAASTSYPRAIRGTVSAAPYGRSVQGLIVYACPAQGRTAPEPPDYRRQNCYDRLGQIRQVVITSAGRSAPYRISGLVAGRTYFVWAIRDDGDRRVEQFEINPYASFGAGYSDGTGRIVPVRVPSTGINLRMPS